MILDPARMTISHEGQVWEPTMQQMRLIVGMSADIGRVWSRGTLLGMMASSAGLSASVNTQIANIRRAFRQREWGNPIRTRSSGGYAWTLPVTLAPAVHAPAAGADEFHFRKA